jgi:hypothetical protein
LKTEESGLKNEIFASKFGKWPVFSKCGLKRMKSGLKTSFGT